MSITAHTANTSSKLLTTKGGKPVTSHLTLTLDVGASMCKGIYEFSRALALVSASESELFYMCMDSEIMKIPYEIAKTSTMLESSASPEDSAWIKLKARDDEVSVVGLLAKRLKASKAIHELKYENAGLKCLAFIGAIVAKHQLSPRPDCLTQISESIDIRR